MTMEEARVVVLQRAVALLVASIDKNRLPGLTQHLAASDEAPELRQAAAEMTRMIDACRQGNLPLNRIPWPRRG